MTPDERPGPLPEIDALQRGDDLPETRGLTEKERASVLAELKAIMAVYGERCSVD